MQVIRWKQEGQSFILVSGEDQALAIVQGSGTPGYFIAQDMRVNPFSYIGMYYSQTAAQKGAEKYCGVEASRLSFIE